ncbi:hypothetical protein A3Q56_04486 [Intoshia linei]|uniref:Major facilitator superfamily (MFS) profile domain-containing protein n=1 Tax=Intoshia linei TaxID=1819745 RepID=A0A177B239_9BILA|nr:hypothetical protein A3Q56_04486 [Intoshia linei]
MAKEMANYLPGVDASKIMILMSFYSLPNIVFAFIGGFVINGVLGLKNGAITFAITVFVGYTIEIIGVFSNQFGLMYMSRLIFGLGGESIQITANAYIIKSYYFQHKYDYTDIKAGVVTGTVFIIASVVSPIIGFLVDVFSCSIYWMQSGLHSVGAVWCTSWPMVALIVKREHIGTALGLTQSIQNLGLSTIFILVGYISKTCLICLLSITSIGNEKRIIE